jgi:hypothetical protein
MPRKTGVLSVALLIIGTLFWSPAAFAGVQKVVVCEDFTATW